MKDSLNADLTEVCSQLMDQCASKAFGKYSALPSLGSASFIATVRVTVYIISKLH